MSELSRAMWRAQAAKTEVPVIIHRKRERLIGLSLRYQGHSASSIRNRIDRVRSIEMMPDEEAKPLLAHIVHACCIHYGVTREAFLSSSRLPINVKARQVAFYLAKTMTNSTLATIGKHMNKDRTNVEHGYGVICHKLQDDNALLDDVDHIKTAIKNYIEDEAIRRG